MTLLMEPEPAQLGDPEPGYDIEITPEIVDGELVYMARHPDLPGCMSHGSTPDEARDSLAEAREMYLEALESSGIHAPEPKSQPRTLIATLHMAGGEDEPRLNAMVMVRIGGGAEMELKPRRTVGTSG